MKAFWTGFSSIRPRHLFDSVFRQRLWRYAQNKCNKFSDLINEKTSSIYVFYGFLITWSPRATPRMQLIHYVFITDQKAALNHGMKSGRFRASGPPANPHKQRKRHQPFGWCLWSEWRESNSRPLEPHLYQDIIVYSPIFSFLGVFMRFFHYQPFLSWRFFSRRWVSFCNFFDKNFDKIRRVRRAHLRGCHPLCGGFQRQHRHKILALFHSPRALKIVAQL